MKLLQECYHDDEYESYTAKMLCEDYEELRKYVKEHLNDITKLDVEFFANTPHIIEYYSGITVTSITITKQQ